jgi:hypothetical protein
MVILLNALGGITYDGINTDFNPVNANAYASIFTIVLGKAN